ncbi:MAG: phosphatidate cytidylyltransferase [Bacteroidales bacterium]
MNKDIIKRTLSGIAFILIILGALTAGHLTFYLLFALITGLCLYEFYSLASKSGADVQKVSGIITGVTIFSLNFLIAGNFIAIAWSLAIIPLILLILIGELFRKKKNPFRNLSYTLAGLIYPVMLLTLVNHVVFMPFPNPGYNHHLLISLFVLIWSNDTSAYITGKKFGKHKLFGSISPLKSWEGLVGGVFFTILAALVIFFVTQYLNVMTWIILAVIVGIAGTLGDLTASSLKRSAGVKESGKLIPGHGGILDRLDSAIFVFPIAYILLKLLI